MLMKIEEISKETTIATNVVRVKFKGTVTKLPVQKQTLSAARNMLSPNLNNNN